jgi:selenocysteine lyase/cysteine desulfurase
MEPSIRALFRPDPGLTYLDTATYGLPPEPTLRVMPEAADQIRAFRGTATRFSTHVYNDAADIARAVSAIGPLVAQPVASR